MRCHRQLTVLIVSTLVLCILAPLAEGRPPIRTAFFDVYPSAVDSRLDDLPSNNKHCGVCHFDFDGGGQRNAYGAAVETAIGQQPTIELAIQSIEELDSDNDGFSNLIEITDLIHFDNTPTFPGLTAGNVGSVTHVDTAEILDHLTPSGGSDTTPPDVTVLSPNGGESAQAGMTMAIGWTASDASGIARIDLQMSDDGGATWKPIAENLGNGGSYDWFVPNLPGPQTLIRVAAFDGAYNVGSDVSDGSFTILAIEGGVVPTTLRDFELPGTQPFQGAVLDDPSQTCVQCHGNYDASVEPWHNWHGSMMGQAMRDPLFLATLAVAEQDAPSVGDLCLRCHTPGGWQEGRSTDTSGALILPKDRQGVQCDFCHRMVDLDYVPGSSPAQDLPVLDSLTALPSTYANGQFITDPDPFKRGPFSDPLAPHPYLVSPFHTRSDLCGTCHDVSNPAFVAGGNPGEYLPQAFDTAHPDGDLRNMFPVERTFSEWSASEYASTGVYAPQFAGNRPDGIVSTCQDCHMRDVQGEGCNDPNAPLRDDLPLHDLTGGNHFVPDIIATFFPGEVDANALADARDRAIGMLQLAATLELEEVLGEGQPAVEVTVTNETGHKLPSGYPEGRRMWLNVKAFDASETLIYESGAYDAATGVLTHDEDAQIYQIKPGISSNLATALGVEAGPSFHFVLNDSVYSDNRIPPRGFTNAGFTTIQSPPVGHAYADGQYWDATTYLLPAEARFVEVALLYQSTSKEYIEFLRDENVTNDMGQDLYDAWVAQGRAAPVVMAADTLSVGSGVGVDAAAPVYRFALQDAQPNPFNPMTTLTYSVPVDGVATLRIYDIGGRRVRTLLDDRVVAGIHTATWDGRDDRGHGAASGVYLCELRASGSTAVIKLVMLR